MEVGIVNVRKMFAVIACAALLLSGCGSKEAAVYVQSVKQLANMGGIAPGDRFAGMVVSENVAQIQRDTEKTVAELLVKEGDDVKEGQELFRYDTEQLKLTLDKQRLELEQLLSSIESYTEQIAQLTKERDRVWAGNAKLQYTVQIQTLELDKKEAELKVVTKRQEIARSEEILKNAAVLSPVTGRIQSISESGTDNYGNPLPYITIQQAGAYRIKGTLGELQRGGIVEGSRMRILSRTDPNQVWYGTVTLVDYENPSQGDPNEMYYGNASDPMTAASKYPFYVELETMDGLILGQHVYLELDTGDEKAELRISSAFIMVMEDGSAWVWAESGRGRLEKRQIRVGEYDPMTDTFPILEGLTEDDYIAFPDDTICRDGVPTTRTQAQEEGGGA